MRRWQALHPLRHLWELFKSGIMWYPLGCATRFQCPECAVIRLTYNDKNKLVNVSLLGSATEVSFGEGPAATHGCRRMCGACTRAPSVRLGMGPAVMMGTLI